jgi:CheY-like chemotaxis protein
LNRLRRGLILAVAERARSGEGAAEEQESPEHSQGEPVTRGLSPEVRVPQSKVLAVDDSKLVLKMYEMMLRDVDVVYAQDGVEALEKLREHPDIAVMLLDINMPRMSGFEVLASLRSSGHLDRLRVIVVTTEGNTDEVNRGLAAGANAYITKPFSREQLLDLIASFGKAVAT